MNADPDVMRRAEQAKQKLVAQLHGHPGVTLIDIGKEPPRSPHAEEVVLRIHVRPRWLKANAVSSTIFPEAVNGIPVTIVTGEYKLE